MKLTSSFPIASLPKESLKQDKERQLEQKKSEPIVIPRGSRREIRDRIMKNLENLKLSLMSTKSIEYIAESVARQQMRPRKKGREWAKITESKPRKGREIVQTVALPTRNFRRTDVNQTDKRKFHWDADNVSRQV